MLAYLVHSGLWHPVLLFVASVDPCDMAPVWIRVAIPPLPQVGTLRVLVPHKGVAPFTALALTPFIVLLHNHSEQ